MHCPPIGVKNGFITRRNAKIRVANGWGWVRVSECRNARIGIRMKYKCAQPRMVRYNNDGNTALV